MAKRLVTSHTEAPEKTPPIFITLIKLKASELVSIEYESNGLNYTVSMEDAQKQRPVEEFYENMRDMAFHVLKQAEMPHQQVDNVRATGVRLKYDGPGNMASAQLIGWRQLACSNGGFAFALPFKTLGSHVTSQTDGEAEYSTESEEQMEMGDDGPMMKDGSNKVRHSDAATALIKRQVELAEAYINGQRSELSIFDVENESGADPEESEEVEELEEVEA